MEIGPFGLSPLMHSQAQQAPIALANNHAYTDQDVVSQVALRLSLRICFVCLCRGHCCGGGTSRAAAERALAGRAAISQRVCVPGVPASSPDSGSSYDQLRS